MDIYNGTVFLYAFRQIKRQLKKWKSVKTVPHNFSAQYIQEEKQNESERYALNKQLAQMLKGGVIMDVTTPEQAKIAEEAGACAVMALERIPADIRAAGGVSRMSDPKMIKGIQEAVSIPVMAKCRIGHFVEAQILEAIEIDYILMRARYFPRQMMFTILTSVSLKYHLYAEPKI